TAFIRSAFAGFAFNNRPALSAKDKQLQCHEGFCNVDGNNDKRAIIAPFRSVLAPQTLICSTISGLNPMQQNHYWNSLQDAFEGKRNGGRMPSHSGKESGWNFAEPVLSY